MKNRIKLIFENNTYYFDNYKSILKILLKLEYTFKTYFEDNRFYLDVYKNDNLIYSTSIKPLGYYNEYDYLISSFLSHNCNNIFILNDFYLFDDYSGEIIENNENEKEYNIQIKILKNNYFFIFKNQIIFLRINDKFNFLTKKGNFFKAEFFRYLEHNNEKFFFFRYSGIRNKTRILKLSEYELNSLYHSIYNLDNDFIVDYSVYLIYKFNLSYNLMKNPKRILSLNDIKLLGCERGI